MNDDHPDQPLDETTGMPALPSWRSVYSVVLGTFLLWIVLLAALTRIYS